VLPPETKKLDYEVELGVVIGRKGRRIAEKDVTDHIAGFTVTNEIFAEISNWPSMRRTRLPRPYIGKSFETFCPAGPALVTTDEFTWGRPLKMSTKVNGEVRGQSDTFDLISGSKHSSLMQADR
jgi:2-keto-4-pentenoate hydratase/2-oxohepta-3-ene-1,7-dioic acid hydratase in catechol pathway